MEEIIIGFKFDSEIKGYYKVQFYDDEGRCLNHWLADSQIKYFLNRDDAVEYIEEVKSWNTISFTQTLIIKVR